MFGKTCLVLFEQKSDEAEDRNYNHDSIENNFPLVLGCNQNGIKLRMSSNLHKLNGIMIQHLQDSQSQSVSDTQKPPAQVVPTHQQKRGCNNQNNNQRDNDRQRSRSRNRNSGSNRNSFDDRSSCGADSKDEQAHCMYTALNSISVYN